MRKIRLLLPADFDDAVVPGRRDLELADRVGLVAGVQGVDGLDGRFGEQADAEFGARVGVAVGRGSAGVSKQHDYV